MRFAVWSFVALQVGYWLAPQSTREWADTWLILVLVACAILAFGWLLWGPLPRLGRRGEQRDARDEAPR